MIWYFSVFAYIYSSIGISELCQELEIIYNKYRNSESSDRRRGSFDILAKNFDGRNLTMFLILGY